MGNARDYADTRDEIEDGHFQEEARAGAESRTGLGIKLERPLVVFDLETTGTDPNDDRIVQFSFRKFPVGLDLFGDDGPTEFASLVNPGRPIPKSASDVHGIHDSDVENEPGFDFLGPAILDFLGDADLAGFNVYRFDIPLLMAELERQGLDLRIGERKIVDAQRIFHVKEPRDLEAAVKKYVGESDAEYHDASEDVRATSEVIRGQAELYSLATVDELAELSAKGRDRFVDFSGKLVWDDEGDVAWGFGKYQGQKVATTDFGFVNWVLQRSFPSDMKKILRGIVFEGLRPKREGLES